MSNKQRTVPLIPPTVEDAETAIRNLTAKRDALVARGTELATNRASVAYKALSEDDAVAKRKLEEINKESVSHSHELASVDAALVTARSRLETAKLFEARAAQAEHAQAIRDEWAQVEKDLADLDAGFSFAVGAAKRFYERCERMKLHGLKVPPQQTLMMANVVVSALMAMPPPLWRELTVRSFSRTISPSISASRISSLIW